MEQKSKPQFAGDCMGVELKKRGDNDPHITFVICVEDDGLWHRKDVDCSSYWIDELIEQLQNARDFIRTQEPDMCEGRKAGFKFK